LQSGCQPLAIAVSDFRLIASAEQLVDQRRRRSFRIFADARRIQIHESRLQVRKFYRRHTRQAQQRRLLDGNRFAWRRIDRLRPARDEPYLGRGRQRRTGQCPRQLQCGGGAERASCDQIVLRNVE
jgi:hypothetical protein